MSEHPNEENEGKEENEDTERTLRSLSERKLSTKGQAYQSDKVTRACKLSLSRWKSQACSMEELLLDCKDPKEVRKMKLTLQQVMDELTAAYQELIATTPEDMLKTEDTQNLKITIESVQSDHLEFSKRINNIIRDMENRDDRSSTHSQRGRSRHSSISSRRSSKSSSSKKAEAAAEVAALETRLQFVDAEAEKVADLERLRATRDLLAAKARVEAIRIVEEEEDSPTAPQINSLDRQLVLDNSELQFQHGYDDRSAVHGKQGTSPYSKQQQVSKSFNDQSTGSSGIKTRQTDQRVREPAKDFFGTEETLRDITSLARAPLPEPPVFAGDPMTYMEWKAAFETLIHQTRVPSCERVYFLRKYLSGPAKEAVEGYFLLPTASAYEEARALLDRRYGDSFVIANAFRDRLENWPRIGGKDRHGLRKLADFLHQCDTAMTITASLSVLNDEREIAKLLRKLPEWLVLKWARKMADWKSDKGTAPPFREFRTFITRESDILCDPLLMSVLLPNREERVNKPAPIQKRVPYVEYNRNVMVTSATKDSCGCCNLNHNIIECSTFLEQTLTEKKEICMKGGLCFACLQHGHRSKDCKQRSICDLCKRRHPTPLHDPDWTPREPWAPPEIQDAVSHATTTETKSLCTMIVPVLLSHPSDPSREVKTYAMLDTLSDTTFVANSLCRKLQVAGTPTMLCVSTMSDTDRKITSCRYTQLMVRGLHSNEIIALPNTFGRDEIPSNKNHIPSPDTAKRYRHLQRIAGELEPIMPEVDIGLLIGYNCPRALTPREVIPPVDCDLFAMRTTLGWGIVGNTCPESTDPIRHKHCSSVDSNTTKASEISFVHRTSVKEMTPEDFIKTLDIDFIDINKASQSMSLEDKRFISIMDEGLTRGEDGHIEMPLPLKSDDTHLENNRHMAASRLSQLKRRFKSNDKYKEDYKRFMSEMICNGYAERIPDDERSPDPPNTWYIPHHGVYHPKKPNKIRVVFDCSASYQGKSLNDCLLKGPDLTNSLVSVLCLFRREEYAFMCDIRQMFFQFNVRSEHRNLLRFLWWENGDISKDPIEFRMTVHLFGATSSPGCANYALKKCASDEAGTEDRTAEFIQKQFYVDDGLASVASIEEGVKLVAEARKLGDKAGLKLHKFVANHPDLLRDVPTQDRTEGAKDFNELGDQIPLERALGVHWCVESDTLQFRITLQDQPMTRRNILSTIASVYDPLGLISPVLLVGKRIMQDVCKTQIAWDEPLGEEHRSQWEKWRQELPKLKEFSIGRCVKPAGFGAVTDIEVHHFADASFEGYGQCSYLKQVNSKGEVCCSLLMGKSRVPPLKTVSIPRLELTAALVSARMSVFLRPVIPKVDREFFWTDSQVVLGYISNDSKRFHIFVANRVSEIRDYSKAEQWKFIKGKDNPADLASRGCSVSELVNSSWTKGPAVLWNRSATKADCSAHSIDGKDPEVKSASLATSSKDPELKSVSLATSSDGTGIDLSRISDWQRLRRIIAYCRRFIFMRKNKTKYQGQPLTVEELEMADINIIKIVQADSFPEDRSQLQSPEPRHKAMRKGSRLWRLDPFLDKQNVIRVGGRLKASSLDFKERHPVVLPRKHHVSKLLIRYHHEQAQHQGRGMTVNELRISGYWIVGCSAAVASYIRNCVHCRRLRATLSEQKMADLPAERLSVEPPFTYTGVDFFGPFTIKEGRKQLKRYGVMFTCMSSRAVHIEVASSLSTDSFINAWRRITSLRGPIRQLRSDQGTNFIGASGELKRALNEMEMKGIRDHLMLSNCDFVQMKFNPPHSSHMGGCWERQIRTARTILTSLTAHQGYNLSDESLRTFMYEVSAIMNSRPLSVETLNDPTTPRPLTPNHLLTSKTKVVLPPPGVFQREDLYLRKAWRRVQFLCDQFWTRWKREHLQDLQKRQKWIRPRKNLAVGDIVVMKDDLPRNQWRLGRIEEAQTAADGLVRRVRVRVATSGDGSRHSMSVLERPVHQLAFLCSDDASDQQQP